MALANLDGLLWLFLTLGPLLLLQRRLHREIQTVFLLLTRRVDISVVLFSLMFFPGVLLHESSHFISARLLGVRTGRFSLLPRPLPDGRLQLGFVETASTDWFRDALIGAAPLLSGGLFVAYCGLWRLQLLAVWQSFAQVGWPAAWQAFLQSYQQPDFWLWFYLTVAVSSTMLPSASDRRSWLPIGLTLMALLVLGLILGAGPWLLENLSQPFNLALGALAVVFAISALVHLALLLPVWLLRSGLTWVTGLRVVG